MKSNQAVSTLSHNPSGDISEPYYARNKAGLELHRTDSESGPNLQETKNVLDDSLEYFY